MRGRFSPSFVVAVLALVVALGGTAYASALITSANIKNGTIQAVDIKKKTITADRLARTCRKAQVKIEGMCVDRNPSGPATHQPAILTCSDRGGRFMTFDEFLILRGKILANPSKFVWADGASNSYELIGTWGIDSGNFVPQATDLGMNLFGDASAQNFYFRCVTAP